MSSVCPSVCLSIRLYTNLLPDNDFSFDLSIVFKHHIIMYPLSLREDPYRFGVKMSMVKIKSHDSLLPLSNLLADEFFCLD